MDLYVNNQPTPRTISDGDTIGGLLEQMRDENPDLLVVALAINGAPVDADQLEAALATHLSEAGRLDLTADSARTLAAQAVGQAADMLEQTRPHYAAVAELLAAGKPSEAMDRLNECFATWNAAEQSLSQVAQAMELDLAAPVGDGVRPDAMVDALRVLLDKVQGNLESRDFVAVADLVEYDMAETTDGWQRMLIGIQQSLLA